MCYIIDIAKYWVETKAHVDEFFLFPGHCKLVCVFPDPRKKYIFEIFEYAKLIDKRYVRELRRQVCELVDRTIQ